MKRVIATIVTALLLVSAKPLLAEMKCDYVLKDAVVSSTTIYATSDPVRIGNYKFFSYTSKCTSTTGAGTAEYDLEWHTGPFADNNFRAEPTAHGFTDLHTGDTTEAWRPIQAIFPPPAAFGWFVAKGSGSNPSDTQCAVVFCRDE